MNEPKKTNSKKAMTGAERTRKHAEKLKQQGERRAGFFLHDRELESIQKLAKAHGISQSKLVGIILAGQVKLLTELEELFETMPPDAAKLARRKALHLSGQGCGILPLLEQIGSQEVEEMAAELPADEAEALRKKYDFKNPQSLREAQEGAA